MVVVTVISLLALIVIPRIKGATRQGREAAMMADLYGLRQAISRFEADTGAYPVSLEDLVRSQQDPPQLGLNPITGREERLLDTKLYGGPYLLPYTGINNCGLPFNPVILDARTKSLDEQWHYRFERGEGIVSCPENIGRAMSGIPYELL